MTWFSWTRSQILKKTELGNDRQAEDPKRKFWEWFEAHENELFNFERDQERIFDGLSNELGRVHPNLVFEFGPKKNAREFVISAGGIRMAFPAVSALVAAAPKLDRWQVTAFRPRRTPINDIQIGPVLVKSEDVEYSLLSNGIRVGIQLFIPGLREDELAFKQIGYLLLDEALGEYDVETKIGVIQMLPADTPRTAERFPLSELPADFDQKASKLETKTLPN